VQRWVVLFSDVADVVVKRWWVMPMARIVVRSGLSFEDMHARLESLFDTDDRLIAEYAPSEPPRRPFQGFARMGEVELLVRIEDHRRRQVVMLVGRGRVHEMAKGSELVLRFRPSAWAIFLLALFGAWVLRLALLAADPLDTLPLFAFPYLVVSVHFWWYFSRAERVLRQAFNG
jgi:hypothetical protein